MSVLKNQLEQELISKVEPVIESLSYKLRDLEILGKSNPTVRVTIDKESQSIGIDDCEKVHEKLSPMFDLWDPFPGHYTLELSSPGEEAPLRLLQHFNEALGGTLRFLTSEAIELPPPHKARRRWEARLESVDEANKSITVCDSVGTHTIPLNKIQDAFWVREWSPNKKKI